MITFKITPNEKDLFLSLLPKLSKAEMQKEFARVARAEFKEVDQNNARIAGHDLGYTTYVDQVQSSQLESVNIPGTIVAYWDLGEDVLDWIYKELQKVAPVLTGRYKSSIIILADFAHVKDVATAVRMSPDVIYFTSDVPYARKMEGTGKRPPQSKQAPKGVFKEVARRAKQRFSNIAFIKDVYVPVISPKLDRWARVNARKNRKPHKQLDKNRRQPAIEVRFK